MKYTFFILLVLMFACTSKTEQLTLADLKAGDRAEIVAIEIPEGSEMDVNLNKRMFKGMGVEVGLVGTSRGPREADRGINYGFDSDEGNYFGLYQPQASMVKVEKITK